MNGRRRIIIVSHALELGGAEKSLLGFLEALDPLKVDVDLFLFRHEGEMISMIPEYVNLLPEEPLYTVLARPMKEILKEGHLFFTLMRAYGKFAADRYVRLNKHSDSGVPLEYSHKYTIPFMPKIQKDIMYDLAISFLTPHYAVAEKIKSRKKIAWIHTDYSSIQINVESELKMWERYDHIVSISETVGSSFLKVFPQLEHKMISIGNMLPIESIRQQVFQFQVDDMDTTGIRLLSIGRFCYAKNFDNIPEICSLVHKMGVNITWYIIGYGPDESLIRKKIKEQCMEKYVVILGKKENPYPYINCCDLYVQPSRYEGKCISVLEAQALGKPVAIADYKTAGSQLRNNYDGVILPCDNNGFAEGLVGLLQDYEKLSKISAACRKGDYSNKEEIEKIYRLLD